MSDDMMTMTPEEEALWRESDEDIEKQAYDTNAAFDEPAAEETEEPEEEEPEATEEVEEDNSEEPEEEVSDEEVVEDETEEESTDETVEEPETEEVEETKAESELKPVRANGMDIPVKSLDEVYQMASMGADYKRKMADIAPFRRSISAMKENDISEADLNMLIDIRKGDKGALQALVKDLGVDPLDMDVDAETKYVPTTYGTDEATDEIQSIVEVISKDPEYKMTQSVIDSQWDGESRKMLSENPAMIRGLHEEIKKGAYAKVAPEALRLEILDQGKKSKLEYYLEAEKMYYEAENANSVQVDKVKSETRQRTVQKKKAAAPTKSRATSSKTTDPDFVNMSDEDYDKFYNEVMRN